MDREECWTTHRKELVLIRLHANHPGYKIHGKALMQRFQREGGGEKAQLFIRSRF